jgi:hypothetical protein
MSYFRSSERVRRAWRHGENLAPTAPTANATTARTLTAFWNGHRWRLVASPSRGDNAALFGVTAS